MARVLGGEVYFAAVGGGVGHEQTGDRPVVVLSHDLFNERSGTVIAMAVTSQVQRAGYPLSWQMPAGSMPRESWVKISQIRTLSTGRLGRRITRLSDDQVTELTDGLMELIG